MANLTPVALLQKMNLAVNLADTKSKTWALHNKTVIIRKCPKLLEIYGKYLSIFLPTHINTPHSYILHLFVVFYHCASHRRRYEECCVIPFPVHPIRFKWCSMNRSNSRLGISAMEFRSYDIQASYRLFFSFPQ